MKTIAMITLLLILHVPVTGLAATNDPTDRLIGAMRTDIQTVFEFGARHGHCNPVQAGFGKKDRLVLLMQLFPVACEIGLLHKKDPKTYPRSWVTKKLDASAAKMREELRKPSQQ